MRDSDVRQALDAIRKELGDLTQRVAALESAVSRAAPVAVASSPPPASSIPLPEPALAEEIVIAITAAVAAFLGERAHVRQIRLISSSAWAQQGRVSVQASHRLAR